MFESNHTKLRLRDTTGNATLVVGINNFASQPDNANINCHLRGRFTLSVESVLELQHWTDLGLANVGFGIATGDAEVEVYADVLISEA